MADRDFQDADRPVDQRLGGPSALPRRVRVAQQESAGSRVNFDDAFGSALRGERGERVADPLSGLSEEEHREYRKSLEDVVRAQRYAETLGAVPRR